MSTGWIKLHRELTEKPIWESSTPEQKVILVTLLIMANHKGKDWEFKGEKYSAKPGQFVTSLVSIAKKAGTGISIQNVRTAITRLEKYEFLTCESTNKNRLITIINWEFYQREDNDLTSKLTGDQQAVNKQLTTNKNVRMKEGKKEVIKDIGQDELAHQFDILWKMYPNKKGKAKAFLSFKSALKKGTEYQTIENGLNAYVNYCNANSNWYKPAHGQTWFNGARWEDDNAVELKGGSQGRTSFEAPKTNHPDGFDW